MRRCTVLPLASAAVAVLLTAFSVSTVEAGNSGHPSHRFGPTPRSYDGTGSPFAYSNCLPWDPKLRTWVWVCGPPYPPGIPVIR